MAEVIRLASSQPRPVRACATCRYILKPGASLSDCGATGQYILLERMSGGTCGPDGTLWEPKPPRTLGIFERAWRVLFGGV